MNRTRASLFAGLTLLSIGWRHDRNEAPCNNGRDIPSWARNVVHNHISFPPYSAQESVHIDALLEMSNIPGADWVFSWGTEYDSSVSHGDARSEMAFVAASAIPDNRPGVAVSSYNYHGCWSGWYAHHANEVDVLYNVDEPWSFGPRAGSPSDSYFRSVALHELGHVTGHEHENRVVATMGNNWYAWFGPDRDFAQLHADDRQGLRAFYPSATTGTDYAVHLHKLIGSVNEYGDYAACEHTTSVYAGQTAFVEYTLENRGTGTVSFTAFFYLIDSSNNRQLIDSASVSMAQGATSTQRRFVIIPSNVPVGVYRWSVDLGGTPDSDLRNNRADTENSMLVRVATCGDGLCQGPESCSSCAGDCGTCAYCGDLSCNGGESCSSCPGDCGACNYCGDFNCDFGESCSSCPSDCGGGCSCGSCADGSMCCGEPCGDASFCM
jgi:hypothetical protein